MFENLDAYIIFSEPNRFYYTGFYSSYGCVVLTKGERFFITDARYASEAREKVEGFKVLTVSAQGLYADVKNVLTELNASKVGFEDEFVTVADYEKIKNEFASFELVSASNDIALERVVKSDIEIAKVTEAQSVTQKALLKTLPLLKVGVTEKEISNEITYQMLSLGAEALAFENIVAFGVNTANPHHHCTDKKLEKNDLITFDIGAKVNGYCGDMTRTFSIGNPAQNLRQIHTIVLEAQQYALQNLKAGITGREAHLLASEYITAHGYGSEFTHSLGHGIGVEVHERPHLSIRSNEVLKENMITSVEPGIYVDGLGGVRIEDLVVIKEGGIQNITSFDKNINL